MSHEMVGLLGLAVTLLGIVVASTWRFSALASSLTEAVRRLDEKEKAQDERLKLLDGIPAMQLEVEHIKRNHSLIPKHESRLVALEQAAKFSKEWRRLSGRGSRPDVEDEDD